MQFARVAHMVMHYPGYNNRVALARLDYAIGQRTDTP